jgi:hypothetical protein
MLCNRQRLKDLNLMKPETKKIFNILNALNILGTNVCKYHLSKLALLVIYAIDDYNYNINSVDIHD